MSITPTSASNKILVFAQINGIYKTNSNANTEILLRLVRASTTIVSGFGGRAAYTGTTYYLGVGGAGINYLDNPATTSATTYKVQFNIGIYGGEGFVQMDNSSSSLVLMEVEA